MTPKERINAVLSGIFPDKTPFIPAIYEHKASLIKKTPSEVCQNGDLLYQSVITEYETYHPDIITVGIDIYNIEAEAIGCKINYSDRLMVPSISDHILGLDNLKTLKIPDPEKDGRMPLILDVARRVNSKIGNEVYVAVGISGPYSLASSLMGDENLLIASLEDPEYIQKVLYFSLDVLKKYTESISKSGIEVIVFDSAAAPPLVSPNMYKNSILPVVKELFDFLKFNGSKFLSYIVGGDTKSILNYILQTGANNILCDFNADLEYYLTKAEEKNISLRKNINPSLIISDKVEELTTSINEVLNLGKKYPGFILGTGILPYDTPTEKVQFIKNFV